MTWLTGSERVIRDYEVIHLRLEYFLQHRADHLRKSFGFESGMSLTVALGAVEKSSELGPATGDEVGDRLIRPTLAAHLRHAG